MEEQKKQIILKISDSVYGGFQVCLPQDVVSQNTKEQLISHILQKLESLLNTYNLKELVNKLYDRNWHIHDDLGSSKKIIYICSNK